MPVPPKGPKRKPVEASSRPVLTSGGWKRPAHLKGHSAEGWDHVHSLLRSSGNLGRTDPTLVECYAVQYGLLRSAQALIANGAITTTNSAGCVVSHPAIGILNSATMRIKAIVNDLGLCPSSSKHAASSVAISSVEKDQAEDDEFDGLLSITG